MPGADALELVNWIPQQFGVRSRKGYIEWAVNLGAACDTILRYQPNQDVLSAYKLFAVTDAGIYDVTSETNAPPLVFALSDTAGRGRFNSTMFTNTAGGFLAACSFEGGYYTYDGADWVRRSVGTEAGTISGIDPDSLVYVASWKRKLWFVEKDSTNAWYLPTDAIAGELRKFELGPFVKSGGKLAFIVPWTIDAGEGMDDLIAFVFEGGDVLVYKGTDPNSAATFAMVGSYPIGSLPTGRRGFTAYGGDVLIVSELGIQPLSYVTRGGQSLLRTQAVDYLSKIQPRVAELVSQYSRQLGWDLTLFAKENLLLLNIPSATTNIFRQYALYMNTNAWCVFEGMPMRCAAVANNDLWFGTEDGRVCKGFSGYFDNVPFGEDTGYGIQGSIQPSFSYFGAPGQNKHFLMARATFMAVDIPAIEVSMVADFNIPRPSGAALVYTTSGAKWDTAVWDSAKWAGALNVFQSWVSVEAIGFTGSAYIRTNVVGDTFLASLDYMFEVGGPL